MWKKSQLGRKDNAWEKKKGMGIYDLKLEDKYITGSVHSLVAALQVTSMCSDNHVNSLSS